MADRDRQAPAPILADAMQLYTWLHGRFGSDPRVLPRALCAHSLALIDALVLAFKGRDREDRLAGADERLICLRAQVRLAATCDLLTDAQVVHVLGFTSRIGRQLGGWIRRVERIV